MWYIKMQIGMDNPLPTAFATQFCSLAQNATIFDILHQIVMKLLLFFSHAAATLPRYLLLFDSQHHKLLPDVEGEKQIDWNWKTLLR